MEIIDYNSNFYPSSLKKIKNPPKKLYAIGNVNLLNTTCFLLLDQECVLNMVWKWQNSFLKNFPFKI